MRRILRKKICNLIDILFETNSQLSYLDVEDIYDILSQSQSALIEVGNELDEGVPGEKTLVGYFEEYCELLWQISQNVTAVCEYLDELNKLLNASLNELAQIEDNYEIVFMPYKASMWDCMDTVYRAARTDERCKVYVVPIPYYNKDAEGKLAEKYYEIDDFPADVIVTPHNEYSLEEHCPDVIYIHNPYDGFNKVSSVEPSYYSSILKKYTDMLVYIPYFSLPSHLPETHKLLPAYAYADKIILGSELMVADVDAVVPRKRLEAMGSPKDERLCYYDKHRDELNILESWKDKLEGRRVVFYNTSISNFLEYGDARLDRIEEFISVMELYENREIAVIWRPHPLLRSTIISMRPDLLSRYEALVEKFLNRDYVILDETPDPVNAVILSDIYVGDMGSSMVQMFYVLGKLCCFQVWADSGQNEGKVLLFDAGTKFENIYNECRISSLEDAISDLRQGKIARLENKCNDTIGENIHKLIMEELQIM